MKQKSFNVLLVGDGGVGKTNYINKLLTNKFKKEYVITQNIEEKSITFNTNDESQITFNLYEYFQDHGKIPNIDCAIIMVDVTSPITFKNIGTWIYTLLAKYGLIPIIICANKIDTDYRKVTQHEIMQHHFEIYQISVKNSYNLTLPLLEFAKKLTYKMNILSNNVDTNTHTHKKENDNDYLLAKCEIKNSKYSEDLSCFSVFKNFFKK